MIQNSIIMACQKIKKVSKNSQQIRECYKLE